MSFDWTSFLNQYRIEYSTAGPNVSAGNVTVHCPFCGQSDQSQHMSISIEGKGWRCWKNPTRHSGRNPIRLVRQLLNCSFEQAEQIVGSSTYIPDDFMSKVQGYMTKPTTIETNRTLVLPDQFMDFNKSIRAAPYLNYLQRRGFHNPMATAHKHNLLYARHGPFHGRIIFPVHRDSHLITWTGRTISSKEQVRYKTLTTQIDKAKDEGLEPAIDKITNCLLWYDELKRSKAKTIVLCEGPFDALKIDEFGWRHGVTATCFFTKHPSERQIDLMHEILPRFEKRILLLDRDAYSDAVKITRNLSSLRLTTSFLININDPGEMTEHDVFEHFA